MFEPPNLDGCECPVSAGVTQSQCCGTMTPAGNYCPISHNDGVGQTFWDCQPTGSYDEQLAEDACAAFTGNSSQCTTGDCEGQDGGPDGDFVVCSSGSPTDCVCWTYQGPNSGYVHNEGASGISNCYCANKQSGDPQYH
jgi:hypothetical protein